MTFKCDQMLVNLVSMSGRTIRLILKIFSLGSASLGNVPSEHMLICVVKSISLTLQKKQLIIIVKTLCKVMCRVD